MFTIIKKSLDRFLETIVITVFAALVADVIWQVFTRFILKNPSKWTEELAVFMLIWISMLGSAVALERRAHLGIDYFVGKLPLRIRTIVECFTFFAIAAFSFFVMILGGIDLVKSTLELEQVSPALGIKVGYIYIVVPISGFFHIFYSTIALISKCSEFSRNQIKI